MPKFENLGEWVLKTFKTQKKAAIELKTTQSVISQWVSGERVPSPENQNRIQMLGYDGPFPKETRGLRVMEPLPYIQNSQPGEYAAEAFLIVAEAARAGGAPLDSLEPKAVAEVIGSIADAVAQGRGEEARLRLVRKAETILQAMKR